LQNLALSPSDAVGLTVNPCKKRAKGQPSWNSPIQAKSFHLAVRSIYQKVVRREYVVPVIEEEIDVLVGAAGGKR
jgi:hypothetical protein